VLSLRGVLTTHVQNDTVECVGCLLLSQDFVYTPGG
jgi:hypothetical protein